MRPWSTTAGGRRSYIPVWSMGDHPMVQYCRIWWKPPPFVEGPPCRCSNWVAVVSCRCSWTTSASSASEELCTSHMLCSRNPRAPFQTTHDNLKNRSLWESCYDSGRSLSRLGIHIVWSWKFDFFICGSTPVSPVKAMSTSSEDCCGHVVQS